MFKLIKMFSKSDFETAGEQIERFYFDAEQEPFAVETDKNVYLLKPVEAAPAS